MAGSEDRDKGRHFHGPRALGALVPVVTRPAFRRGAPAAAQILADWTVIVGPSLAAQAIPRRLVRGTLTLACTGPAALELQHLSAALIERINAHLGAITVHRLRFVQERPPVSASPLPHPRPAAAVPPAVDLPPGELRDALERLGRMVLTNRPRE